MQENKFLVNKKDIVMVLVTTIYFLGLFRIYIIPTTIFKILSIIICSFTILTNIKYSNIKKMKSILILILIIFLSTFYNNNYNTGLSNGIFYFLQFASLFIYTSSIANKYTIDKCVNYYYYASLILMIIMDVSVLIGIDLDRTHYQNLITYLLGNKFMVSYLHMQAFGLYSLKNYRQQEKYNKIKTIIFGISGILICKYVDCSTGIVGNFLILILLLMPIRDKEKKLMTNSTFILILFLVLNLLLLSGQILLQNGLIKYVIENILNESMTLTGRTKIYEIMGKIILKKPLLGYGYNSDIITIILGYGNAQNGILQFLLDCGIAGTISFFIVLWNYTKKQKNFLKNWSLYCMLYAFLVCSLVEVCLKFNFFIIIALFMVISMYENKITDRS